MSVSARRIGVAEQVDQRKLVKQVGGVFHLCSLVQKRMRELVMGARPLVEVTAEERRDLLSIVLREIKEEKIGISEEGEVVTGPEPRLDLASTIDISDLSSIVSDEDLAVPLPGDEDEEEEDEDDETTKEAESVGLTVEGLGEEEEEEEEEEKEKPHPDVDLGSVDDDEEEGEGAGEE